MIRRIPKLTRYVLPLAAAAMIVISAGNLPASLRSESSTISVEIEGVDYGSFNRVKGLNTASNANFKEITLGRDFVTEPSLYLWAKTNVNQHKGLKDIHLIRRNEHGAELERFVLKYCQPMSWSVEAANPALGGFHEQVKLAVQTVEQH